MPQSTMYELLTQLGLTIAQHPDGYRYLWRGRLCIGPYTSEVAALQAAFDEAIQIMNTERPTNSQMTAFGGSGIMVGSTSANWSMKKKVRHSMAALFDQAKLNGDGTQRVELYEGGEVRIIDDENHKEIKLPAIATVNLHAFLTQWQNILRQAESETQS